MAQEELNFKKIIPTVIIIVAIILIQRIIIPTKPSKGDLNPKNR